MDSITFLGIAAAFMTTASFVPQALKTIREKHTKDISLSMYIIFNIGVVLWLIYGILISNLPVILANVVTLFFTLTILIMKIRYK